jgi:GTP:adenosylcobinamide-phosphate guanylyltransferase
MSENTASHFDVLLPAAGRISGDYAQAAGHEIKALVKMGGCSVLERTIAALRETNRVARIAVIGPREMESHEDVRAADLFVLEGTSGPDNVFRGLEKLGYDAGNHARVLAVTTDLPFLSAPALNAFLDASDAFQEADICLPTVEKRAFERAFPESCGEYVRLRDGSWTLGCAFLFRASVVAQIRPHAEAAFEARKNQLAMARLLGPMFIARFLTRRLDIPHVQTACERTLNCSGRVIKDAAPELAFDIDTLKDFRYATEKLKNTL